MLVAPNDRKCTFALRADRHVTHSGHAFAAGGAEHVGGDDGAAVGCFVTQDNEGLA